MKKSPDTSSDDLFNRLSPSVEERPKDEIWTVSRLSGQVKRVIEDGLPLLWLEGEISNFKLHSSGHRYFTLKDEAAQISAVMWRTRPSAGVTFQDGVKVRVYGRVTVWEQAGKYQFDVQNLVLAGIGSLQVAFELLKSRLTSEGLFDSSRKKILPRFPKRIGIVTSPTGAVIHDLAWGITTRFPPAKLFLIPVAVQGEGSASQISDAIDLYNRERLVDVIIIGRGGGSLEDLWAFNEEVVVRAIARSIIPIISAVGHEVDFTLSDLAADLRAPTPTGAAALVVPDRKELLETLDGRNASLFAQLSRLLTLWKERLARITQSYSFKRLPGRISDERLKLDEIARRNESALERTIKSRQAALTSMSGQIGALSPRSVLSRGYGIIRKTDGTLVRNSGNLSIGEHLNLLFASGGATVTVDEIEE